MAKIGMSLMRGLFVKQKGRCALTGIPLTPKELTGDHIYPLALQKTEGNPIDNDKNIWLVHKDVNRMKNTLTYNQLIDYCKLILKHAEDSRELMESIHEGGIETLRLKEFDDIVNDKYNPETDTVDLV